MNSNFKNYFKGLAAIVFLFALTMNFKMTSKTPYSFSGALSITQKATGECIQVGSTYCPPEWGNCCYEGPSTACKMTYC